MGMTDLRPYVMRIIGHNSVNAHQIPTKLGTENHCNEPLSVPNFRSTHSCLWRILQSVRKEEVEEGKN